MRRLLLPLALAGALALGWMARDRAKPRARAAPEAPLTEARDSRRLVAAERARAGAGREGSSAIGLLAAARLSGNVAWLREAAAQFPDDPRVRLALLRAATTDAERAVALEGFRQADPGNALGPYLAAGLAARRGDPVALAGALVDAADAPIFDRRELEVILTTEAALREAGADDAAALEEAMARANLVEPDLVEVGRGMGELQRVLIGLGEWDEADFLMEQALALGEDLRSQPLAIDNLTGLAIETSLLGALDPETVVDWQGTRAGERLAALDAERKRLAAAAAAGPERTKGFTAADWAEYRRRLAAEGELAALEWAAEK